MTPESRRPVDGGRIRRSGSARFLLLALIASLLGCVDEQQEQKLGNSLAADLNEHLPLIQDPQTSAYVDSMGSALARVSSRPGLDYEFYVINSNVVNAFALPGGHIYITRGLIERTRSGTELAGVLAHEIGHVAARHGVQKLERELRTGSLVGLLYNLFLGGEPELLRRQPLELAGTLWSARHSRQDEAEADRLAVKYLIDAGVNPDGIITLFQELLEEEASDPRLAQEWFSTHPLTASRIASVKREIADAGQPDLQWKTEFPAYGAFLRRLQALPILTLP
ncbi:MAG TPA: M48 family metallopeptidase [Longimicrobiaceae bacterium]|nr:M48 family metallopeptidase [Longimicrobiaceae bacterium]